MIESICCCFGLLVNYNDSFSCCAAKNGMPLLIGVVMSLMDELRKLAELRREQLIDDEEYVCLKQRLIAGTLSDDDEFGRKNIEFYASTVNGWLSYRQEGNKQLLLLSSGALALLVSMVSSETAHIGEYGFHFFLVLWCAVTFFICLSSSLLELKYSPPYLESLVADEPDKVLEFKLALLEKVSNWTFWLGAVGFFVLVFYKLR